MGHPAGRVLQSDCGAELVYLRHCPDDALVAPRCACGAEFVSSAECPGPESIERDDGEMHVWERSVGVSGAVTVYFARGGAEITTDLPDAMSPQQAREIAMLLLDAVHAAEPPA